MAGIYIHIPFCKQACSYCDFHFSTNLSRKSALLNSIEKELELRAAYLNNEVVESIYFGGGTPSLLSEAELNSIFEKLHKAFTISNNAEISLEANPDDLGKSKLEELKQTPINRLSIGIQSFFDEDLTFMNRAHNATEAINSIKNAQDYGFEKLSIDLIFGSQSTSNQMWESNLKQFFELNISHLSAYSLTIEEKTLLANQIMKGTLSTPDDEKNFEQYIMLQNAISANGFEQYELSNYCKNENYSKHNTSYWKGISYLGLGPSAHSYNEISRQWNVRNNAQYIKAIEQGDSFFEKEILSENDRYNEYLITSLRTKWGVNLAQIKHNFSRHIQAHFSSQVQLLDQGKIKLDDASLVVKNEFLFQSDEILRVLMIAE